MVFYPSLQGNIWEEKWLISFFLGPQNQNGRWQIAAMKLKTLNSVCYTNQIRYYVNRSFITLSIKVHKSWAYGFFQIVYKDRFEYKESWALRTDVELCSWRILYISDARSNTCPARLGPLHTGRLMLKWNFNTFTLLITFALKKPDAMLTRQKEEWGLQSMIWMASPNSDLEFG